MRIAQVASCHESTPPRGYGSINRIVGDPTRVGEFTNQREKLKAARDGAELDVRVAITRAYRFLYYPTEEFGFDIGKEHPAIATWLDRVKALPGWAHPYDLMPGHPLPGR